MTRLPRLFAWLMLALLIGINVTTAAAQEAPERLRFPFRPQLDEDIAYRVDYRHEQNFLGRKQVVDWTHEVHFRFGATEPDGIHSGTFSIRAVSSREGADDDLHRLFAKAVEGETYSVKTFHGLPVEIDWPAVKARIAAQLPQLTDPFKAALLIRTLPLLEENDVQTVLRPFWATGIGYLRDFKLDGSIASTPGMELPSWFQVPGSTLNTYGGRLEGTEDMMLAWQLLPEAKAAGQKLGAELKGLLAAATTAAERTAAQGMIDRATGGEIEAAEGGVATYDLTPGLMREVQLDIRLVMGDFRRETRVMITRLKPE